MFGLATIIRLFQGSQRGICNSPAVTSHNNHYESMRVIGEGSADENVKDGLSTIIECARVA